MSPPGSTLHQSATEDLAAAGYSENGMQPAPGFDAPADGGDTGTNAGFFNFANAVRGQFVAALMDDAVAAPRPEPEPPPPEIVEPRASELADRLDRISAKLSEQEISVAARLDSLEVAARNIEEALAARCAEIVAASSRALQETLLAQISAAMQPLAGLVRDQQQQVETTDALRGDLLGMEQSLETFATRSEMTSSTAEMSRTWHADVVRLTETIDARLSALREELIDQFSAIKRPVEQALASDRGADRQQVDAIQASLAEVGTQLPHRLIDFLDSRLRTNHNRLLDEFVKVKQPLEALIDSQRAQAERINARVREFHEELLDQFYSIKRPIETVAGAQRTQTQRADAIQASLAEVEAQLPYQLNNILDRRLVALREELHAHFAALPELGAALKLLQPHLESVFTGQARYEGAIDAFEQGQTSKFAEVRAALGETAARLEAQQGRLLEVQKQGAGEIDRLRGYAELLVNRHVIPLANSVVAIRSPYGYVFAPAEDAQLVAHIGDGTPHEPGTSAMIGRILQPGDTAIDAGAHIGLMTLLMSRAVGPQGKVIAIEPAPVPLAYLKLMLQIQGLTDIVDVHSVALSNGIGEAELHIGTTAGISSLLPLPNSVETVRVQTSTLNRLVARGRKVALVKMDIEGMEPQAVAGMQRLVADNPEIIVVAEFGPSHLVRAGISVDEWLGAFRAIGFDEMYEIDENLVQCHELRSVAELGSVYSVNLVMARTGAERLARLPIL
ncbi:MAG TPA: FkbM family methyltransferase [Stellaceae bacterium]